MAARATRLVLHLDGNLTLIESNVAVGGCGGAEGRAQEPRHPRGVERFAASGPL